MLYNRKTLFGVLITCFLGLLIFSSYGVDRVTHKYFTPFSFELFIGVVTSMFFVIPVLQKSIPSKFKFQHYLYLGVGIRVLLFFAEPNLSDDYFRYIWDGTLLKNGYNPFHHLPSEVIEWKTASEMGFSSELYESFNSQNYYSVYPPVNQFVFWISALIGNGDVYISNLVIRFFMLLSEFGSIYFLLKLLLRYRIPLKHSLFYILNPLILLELTVNLHFEGFMIFFLLGAIYMFETNRIYWAGVFWGFAICTKLLPLVFLPLLLFRYPLLKTIKIGSTAILTTVILFLPFYSDTMLPNMLDSINKYFGFFFFNAGIPYVIREYYLLDYDKVMLEEMMSVFQKIFGGFILLYSILIAFFKKTSLANYIFWAAFMYFFLAGILHPWYITILVPMGILAKRWTGIIWSFTIFFSYSAYRSQAYEEDYVLIAMEFSIVLIVLISETIFRKQLVNRFFKEAQ